MRQCVSIGSDNGLPLAGRQAYTWTIADVLSFGRLRTNFSKIRIKNTEFFIHENALEEVVCEMAAILPSGPFY